MPPIVLAHSGAPELDTAIGALASAHGADVVTLTLDLGQPGRVQDVHERALAHGAARAHVIDAREEFARAMVCPEVRAAAVERRPMPDVRALVRVVVARHLVEMARLESAGTVAYGGRWRTDEHPLTPLVLALDSSLDCIAIARAGLDDEGDRAGSPKAAPPDSTASVALTFARGLPVAVNGVEMSPLELLQSLETIARAHGIGRAAAGEGAMVPLYAAYGALQRADAGVVRLALHDGAVDVVEEGAAVGR